MSKLAKTAYELACERIIVSKYAKDRQRNDTPPKRDFIPIPEFEDKDDKVVPVVGFNDRGEHVSESQVTKLITEEDLANIKKKEEPREPIKIQEAQTFHTDDIMEIYWNGNFMDYGGFGRMNRAMAFGLSDRNVRVKLDIEPYLVHVNRATQEQLRMMANVEISPTAPKVFGVTVPLDSNHKGKKILYTMIESSEKVHKDYAEKLNLMNEIWVATEYGKYIMQRSNVHPPIYVMPLGVDIDRYKPDCGTVSLGSATRSFRFLSVFRWSFRKGFDILLRAYLEEFSNDDDVSLVMATREVERMEDAGVQRIVEDFNNIKSGIGKNEEDMPHVMLYSKPIDEKDMPKIYNSAHAFCLISRGEGFGLPYIESSACGLPVIASSCSGQSDFLNNENSFLVEPEGYIEAKSSGNLSRMAKLCHFYEGQIFPDFGEKSIKKTREHMRFVYENYSEAKEKNEKLRSLIARNYTWSKSVDRVYNRLREIL